MSYARFSHVKHMAWRLQALGWQLPAQLTLSGLSAAAVEHHHRERGYMTGQPVDSVVNAGSSLPAPVAVGQAGTQAFQAPEKRIHNQAELDRHDAVLPYHAVMLPSSGLTKGSSRPHCWQEKAYTEGLRYPLCMQKGASYLGVGCTLSLIVGSYLISPNVVTHRRSSLPTHFDSLKAES